MKKYIEQYQNLYNNYEIKCENYERKIQECERKIEYYKKQRKKLKWVSWVDVIVGGFAKEICDRFDLHYDIYGPFGMSCRTSVYFCKKEKFNICEDQVIKITIVPQNLVSGLLCYETGETTNEYQKGSIGEMNGYNNVIAELPNDINEIIMLLKGDEDLLKEIKSKL